MQDRKAQHTKEPRFNHVKFVDGAFKKIYKRFKARELPGLNKGYSSTGFNEAMNGGGHATFKKKGKWYKVADWLRARLGLESILLKLFEQSDVTAIAGEGLVWVKNSDPTELWFTDDDDRDYFLAPRSLFSAKANAQSFTTATSGDIDWDTELIKEACYTHSAGSDNIIVGETGWYKISYAINLECLSTNRLNVKCMVYDDGTRIGQGDSQSYLRYNTYGRYGTCVNSFLAYIESGSVIDIRWTAMLEGGSYGETVSFDVLADSQITIERVR